METLEETTTEKASKETPPKDCIENWSQCDSLDLAKHFQDPSHRTSQFYLREEAIKAIKDLKSATTKEIVIHMGLSQVESDPNSITFSPVIEVIRNNSRSLFNFQENDNRPLAEVIPHSLKGTLVRNWLELEHHLIDDACFADIVTEFDVYKKDETSYLKDFNYDKKRLLHYDCNGNEEKEGINYTLFEVLNRYNYELKHFLFCLGFDYNKFHRKHQFSFSPILELHFPKKDISLANPYAKRYMSNNTEIVDIEYMTPCPPC